MPKLIVAVLPKGKVKKLSPVLKKAGIYGATVLSGKGLCAKEAVRTLGRKIGASREILMVATLDANSNLLVRLLNEHGKVRQPGEGVVFVLDVGQVIG